MLCFRLLSLPVLLSKLGARQALAPETALLLSGTQGRGIALILNTLFIFDSLELSGTSDSRLTKIKNKYSFSVNHNESIKE